MVLTWGPSFIQFYNDAYSKLIGDKPPASLGVDIRVTMAEAWDTLGPMLQKVLATGVVNWTPTLMLLLERSGYREESYFSVSHAPAEDDEGRSTGMLAVCSEVTSWRPTAAPFTSRTHQAARPSTSACRAVARLETQVRFASEVPRQEPRGASSFRAERHHSWRGT